MSSSAKKDFFDQQHPFMIRAWLKRGLIINPETGELIDLEGDFPQKMYQIYQKKYFDYFRLDNRSRQLEFIADKLFELALSRALAGDKKQAATSPQPMSDDEWAAYCDQQDPTSYGSDAFWYLDSLHNRWKIQGAKFIQDFRREMSGQKQAIAGLKDTLAAVARRAEAGRTHMVAMANDPATPAANLLNFHLTKGR